MQQILILGGGAAGLAAALAAAQTAEGRAHITVLDKIAKVGKSFWPPATGAAISTTGTSRRSGTSPAAPKPCAAC